ncbi:MAG: hypothetical protein CMQ21_10875 [Gammaproteobacteria bacterium]|nr:hypothetical protein [Gammaproteobacteria bacterium]
MPCKKAVYDFRTKQGIKEDMQQIDAQAIFWRKQAE